MHLKTENPFTKNPLTSLDRIELVKPAGSPPETHEARKPLRSYLGSGGGGLGELLSGLGGGQRSKPTVVLPGETRPEPTAEAPSAEVAETKPEPARWGRR
jgi:hypothetical protein